MDDKNELNLRIIIDTVYGLIGKHVKSDVKDITEAEILDKYLTETFSIFKHAIIEDFKQMKEDSYIPTIKYGKVGFRKRRAR